MLLMLLFGLGTSQLMLVVLLIAQQPIWAGIGLGLTATAAALIKLPAATAGLFGAPWSGHLAARHGARRAAIVGTVVISGSWIAMSLWHHTVWQLVVLTFIAVVGGSMLYAAIPNLIVEVARDRAHQRAQRHVARSAHRRYGDRHPGGDDAAGERHGCRSVRRSGSSPRACGLPAGLRRHQPLRGGVHRGRARACRAAPAPCRPERWRLRFIESPEHEKSRDRLPRAHRRRRVRRQPEGADSRPARVRRC